MDAFDQAAFIDNDRVFVSHSDGWDIYSISTGKLLHHTPMNERLERDGPISVAANGKRLLFATDQGIREYFLDSNSPTINEVEVLPTDALTKRKNEIIQAHEKKGQEVTASTISADNSLLAIADSDQYIYLYHLSSNVDSPVKIPFYDEGKIPSSGGINPFQTPTKGGDLQQLQQIQVQQTPNIQSNIGNLNLDDGLLQNLSSGEIDNEQDQKRREEEAAIWRKDQPPICWLSFSPDGKYLVADNKTQQFRTWEVDTLKPVHPLSQMGQRLIVSKFMNEETLIVINSSGQVLSWDVKGKKKELFRFNEFFAVAYTAAISEDNKLLAFADEHRPRIALCSDYGRLYCYLPTEGLRFDSLHFSSDNKKLIGHYENKQASFTLDIDDMLWRMGAYPALNNQSKG